MSLIYCSMLTESFVLMALSLCHACSEDVNPKCDFFFFWTERKHASVVRVNQTQRSYICRQKHQHLKFREWNLLFLICSPDKFWELFKAQNKFVSQNCCLCLCHWGRCHSNVNALIYFPSVASVALRHEVCFSGVYLRNLNVQPQLNDCNRH